MSTAAQLDFIKEQEYLAGEQISELKYEYIDGYVCMPCLGASNNHNLIVGNVFATLGTINHLKRNPVALISLI